MKKTLEKLLLCDLYQVSEDVGYIEKSAIHGKSFIGSELNFMPFVHNMGSVMVKKSGCFKYNLRELLTGTPINTLYEESHDYSSCDWYNHTVKGNQTEYDTFILVPSIRREITVDQLEDYINSHDDVESFRVELEDLLRKGSHIHFNKKMAEIEKAGRDDLKVKALLKSIKRSK